MALDGNGSSESDYTKARSSTTNCQWTRIVCQTYWCQIEVLEEIVNSLQKKKKKKKMQKSR